MTPSSLRLGWGSFLSIDFGHADPFSPGHGIYHLWIEQAAWALYDSHHLATASAEEPSDIRSALQTLELGSVDAICISEDTLRLTIKFQGGALEVIPQTVGRGHWSFFFPMGVLVVDDTVHTEGRMELVQLQDLLRGQRGFIESVEAAELLLAKGEVTLAIDVFTQGLVEAEKTLAPGNHQLLRDLHQRHSPPQ